MHSFIVNNWLSFMDSVLNKVSIYLSKTVHFRCPSLAKKRCMLKLPSSRHCPQYRVLHKCLLVRVVAVRTSTVYWRWWRTWNISFSCFQLDCGIHPGMSGLESLPFLDEIDTAEIDLLLVSQWVIKMMMITTAIIVINNNNNNY